MERSLKAILARCQPDGDCLIWTRYRTPQGYGQAVFDGVDRGVHCVVWEIVNDMAVPSGLGRGYFVCHTCDNRACVRPEHLWLGTHEQNMLDCKLKGRARGGSPGLQGEAHPSAKLTEDQVRAIRVDLRPQSQISAEYGVSQQTVSRIRKRANWKHLGFPGLPGVSGPGLNA